MGREVRRVPPNWAHPSDDEGHLVPMYDKHIDDARAEWLAEFDRIRAGDLKEWEQPYYGHGAGGVCQWAASNAPPDEDTHSRPWRDSDATWFQVWETVSEGTPVTPPFATQAELVDYLVEHGDLWQQQRYARGDTFMQPNPPGYTREAAEAFVTAGWAPSMIVVNTPGKPAVIAEGIDSAAMVSP